MAPKAKNEQNVLQSILFKKGDKPKAVDSELDDIFKHSAGASSTTAPLAQSIETEAKRKRKEEVKDLTSSPKRRKVEKHLDSPVEQTSKAANKKGKVPKKVSPSNAEGDEDDPQLENNYLRKLTKSSKPARPEISSEQQEEDEEAPPASGHDSDEEQDIAPPVHESTLNRTSSTSRITPKYVKPDESKEDKERRTIFIGNLPVETAKSKTGKKAIINHIKEHVPECKVESVRFRSVAFKTASEPLPSEEGGKQLKVPKTGEELSARDQRDAERVSKWKAENPADGDGEKVFLKPNEKRRVAFIKQDFHDEASTVNAYMVFAYSAPNRSANVPSLLDPFVAAERAIETCDGTSFMDRTIRVDRATSKGAPGSSGDMKLTVFVGNLDFTAKEEDLRGFFEKLVETEVETKEVGSEYVKHVRIIRDGATQLGKGFAYVEFKERSVVDEILALEPQKLKFAKRKIRVQRCKSLPGSTLPKPPAQPIVESQLKSITKGTKPKTPAVGQQSRQKAVPIPKGDPSLGNRLRKLSKEERKAVKSSDPSRVARRLAKKKARNTLQKEGVPVKGKERSKNAKSKPSGTKPKQSQLKVDRPKRIASRG